METVTQCPVCGGGQFRAYLSCTDYLVSRQTFNVQECKTCSFRLTNPRPDQTQIGNYYKSDQYVSHNDSGGGFIDSIYRMVRTYTLRQKLNLVTRLNGKKGRLLDVGCGTGAFLAICQRAGWQVAGTEPDVDARLIASEKVKVSIEPDLNLISSHEPFDIITLWHVLEHVPDLNNTLQALSKLLSAEGTLLIAVPNSDSFDAQYYKAFWAAYDVPRHLHHFTPSTIQPLFEKHDFTLVEQRPMLFDAFYIAMLSSRYRTGKTQYVESLRVGFQSNARAYQSGQASSMLYTFKKL